MYLVYVICFFFFLIFEDFRFQFSAGDKLCRYEVNTYWKQHENQKSNFTGRLMQQQPDLRADATASPNRQKVLSQTRLGSFLGGLKKKTMSCTCAASPVFFNMYIWHLSRDKYLVIKKSTILYINMVNIVSLFKIKRSNHTLKYIYSSKSTYTQ